MLVRLLLTGLLWVSIRSRADQNAHFIPDDGLTVLVGQEADVRLVLNFANNYSPKNHILMASAKDGEGVVEILASDWLNGQGNLTNEDGLHVIRLLGLTPGRAALDFFLKHVDDDDLSAAHHVVKRDYPVKVVAAVDVVQDAFTYIVLSSEYLVLLLLAFRMRTDAVKEVFLQPMSLLASLVCQAVLMPLVSLGLATAFSLSSHSAVCLLLIGCCPSGMAAPLASVMQQAHVELTLVVNLLQTVTAFGLMPLWLYAYSSFLSLPTDDSASPYLYLAVALAVMAAPVLAGIVGHRWLPLDMGQLDKSLMPLCLVTLIIDLCVKCVSARSAFSLLSGPSMFGAALLPLCGAGLGAIVTGVLRQPLTKIKSTALSTAIQNTVLAKVVVQCSYPEAEASVMSMTLACVDVVTLAALLFFYLIHLITWLKWPYYRPLHKSTGIGGFDHTILIEGAINNLLNNKRSRVSNKRKRTAPPKKTIQRTVSTPTGKGNLTVNTLGSLTGRMVIQQSPIGIQPSIDTSSSSKIFLHYLASPELSPTLSVNRSEKSSLYGIDYEMLNVQKSSRKTSPASSRHGSTHEEDYQKNRKPAPKSSLLAKTHSRLSEAGSMIKKIKGKMAEHKSPARFWVDSNAAAVKVSSTKEAVYDKPGLVRRSNSKTKKILKENVYVVNAPNDVVFQKLTPIMPRDDRKDSSINLDIKIEDDDKKKSTDEKIVVGNLSGSGQVSPSSTDPDSGVSELKTNQREDALVLHLDNGSNAYDTSDWVRFSSGSSNTLNDNVSLGSCSSVTDEQLESIISQQENTLSVTCGTEETDLSYSTVMQDHIM